MSGMDGIIDEVIADGARIGPAEVDSGPFGPPHTLNGHIQILRDFRSAVLDNSRQITVYLPPDYFEPAADTRRYPVLYMHDGQNLFDQATAFIPGHDWGVDEAAEILIGEGRVAPLIIVGIDHAGDQRSGELTPTFDARHGSGGRGDHYARMIIEELKPYIDEHYRTQPEREHTGVGGSSLGGLISLYLGVTHPEVFGRIALFSPSLWWDRRRLLQQVRALTTKLPLRIWLDTGTAEGGGTLFNVRMLKNALLRLGWRRGQDLQYVEAAGADHSEAAWALRVGPALEFLFPPEVPTAGASSSPAWPESLPAAADPPPGAAR
jgi:predicted alpha/beta superfamily hydrolase